MTLRQRDLIVKVIEAGAPIVIVEKEGEKRTFDRPVELVEGYDKLLVVKKYHDSIFADFSASRLISPFFDRYDVTKLFVAGDNGSACPRGNILDALKRGLSVLVDNNAVIDFNQESFIYPYVYKENEFMNEQFQQTKSLKESSVFLERKKSKDELSSCMQSVRTVEKKPLFAPRLSRLFWSIKR